jgi:hypothetical protein
MSETGLTAELEGEEPWSRHHVSTGYTLAENTR